MEHAPKLAALIMRKRPWKLGEQGGARSQVDAVVVIGFGPAGRAAAERIAELGYTVTIVDQNPAAGKDARALGYGAVIGDAYYPEVLEHAGLPSAVCVVVTVPGASVALRIVNYLRIAAPHVQILVRARFHRSLADLNAAGAHVVVDEESGVGRQIAGAFEREYGKPGSVELEADLESSKSLGS